LQALEIQVQTGIHGKYIGTPSDADSALAIGAVDTLGEYAFFSSKGPSSDGV